MKDDEYVLCQFSCINSLILCVDKYPGAPFRISGKKCQGKVVLVEVRTSYLKEGTYRGWLGVHVWLQVTSYQLPQWNAISEPRWAQEPLGRKIVIHENETMILWFRIKNTHLVFVYLINLPNNPKKPFGEFTLCISFIWLFLGYILL